MAARVLVVEDDPNLCELLELGLGRRGFRVTWCTRARDALERLEKEEPDVVLTDVNMPEIGGLELCRRIVAARRDLPVVVITAFGSLETAVDAIRAGAYDFVTKPVELEVLAITLDRAVHRFLVLGFPLLTLGVVTGSIWAKRLEVGAPQEVLRIVLGYATWLLIAMVLLLRVAAGWRGRRPAIAGMA